jgi:3-hydroxyacyl-[acyl-carrier-protein] dehydratase
MKGHFTALSLPREKTRELLPQRPPLLLVDEVLAIGVGPRPALRASFQINIEEPVLAGHFPGRPLWPGTYTIEGLAQTCSILGAVVPSISLFNVNVQWDNRLQINAGRGLLARADVKLTRPVIPPAVMIYEVFLTHVIDKICRFDVEAIVESTTVAQGTLTVAIE